MQGGEILFAHVVRLASSQAEFSDVQRAVSGLENYSGEQISRAVCRRKNDHLLNLIATEDNRYFGSGKHGFWRRTEYAVATSVKERHNNGKLYQAQ